MLYGFLGAWLPALVPFVDSCHGVWTMCVRACQCVHRGVVLMWYVLI